MISGLIIKNVALVDSATLHFGEGLNILSGETGSGKSVILDSVNFVLGAKADRSMIRYGERECSVCAEFQVEEDSRVLKELDELDIESDTTIVITRKYNLDGKGSIKINGNPVSLSMLKKVTSCLVDVHGQSEHFYLCKESNQLRVLDGLCEKELVREKEKLLALLAEAKEVKKQLSVFSGNVQDRNKRIDILRFQIDEIESASLKEGEEEELKDKRNKIINSEKIASALSESVSCLTGERGAIDAFKQARRSIASVVKYGREYEEILSRMEELLSEAEDIGDTLSDFSDDFSFDEEEANEVESRLDQIKSLKSKYGDCISEILQYLEKARAEYELLTHCDEEFERLSQKQEKLLKSVYETCQSISSIRQNKAKELCKNVVEELKTLNIAKPAFEVSFREFSLADAPRATGDGLDEICFLFSANAGEPTKALGKIISGGEMSRFMLALKTQCKGINGISTYIFDEIDTGISGKTAKVVAEKIAKIAKDTQVIAVSHLAQMACMSDHQLYIEKKEENGKTLTKVSTLDEAGKVREVVRLLGGEDENGFAVKHAEEMIKYGTEYKNSLKNTLA